MADSATIRVVFLGADESTAGLLGAVLEHERFELAGVCEFEAAARWPELQPLAAKLPQLASWESLLDDSRCDAVIAARGADEELRTEQLRKLVQVDKPVLASHPVVDSMLGYYELDMIRRETGAPLVPELFERQHPAIRALEAIARQEDESPIGRAEQLSVERYVAAPTKESVQRQFARDVDVIRAIAGEMTRLGAMAGLPGTPNYASLGVQMSGPGGIDARWSVVPIESSVGARLTLTGPRGRATVELASDGQPWTLECVAGEVRQTQEFGPWDTAAAAVDALAAAADRLAGESRWVDACRAVELSETVDRSLKKSRTIDLHYEEYTDDATFKGTMASVGCGLLLLTLLAMALAGVAEQMNVPYAGAWQYVLLALFVVFLLLQLILLTSGKPKQPDGNPPAAP